MAIRFYSVNEDFGCFSNFSAHPVELAAFGPPDAAAGKKVWPTTEHYFQAQKFAGTAHEDLVRRAASPMIAARLGRSRQRPLRPDWERVKDAVMRAAVEAKVRQHADVRAALLATGDQEIVEVTTRDRYWGCGSDGKGQNRLGRILMDVRAALRAEEG